MCLGLAGKIVRFEDDDHHSATVDFDGDHKIVNTAVVTGDDDPPGPGDWVLVHLGIAVQRVDQTEVAETQSSYDDLMADFEAIASGQADGGSTRLGV